MLPSVAPQQTTFPAGAPSEATACALWFLCGRLTEQEPLRYIPVHTSPFLVGRKSECALALSCTSVSSLHAELTNTGTGLVLRDLRSTNGTYVNGQRIAASAPLVAGDLIQFGRSPFRLLQQNLSQSTNTAQQDVCSQAMALVLFDRLMTEQSVIPHYQPIIEMATGRSLAWEVLCRSQMPGLETPSKMFGAAAQLNLELPLSRMIRVKAIEETRDCAASPHLFLNTHPGELRSTHTLLESMRTLRALNPTQPLTLEIHEAAVSDLEQMRRLREDLQAIDVSLAFDDFGAGQSRLVELAEVHPAYLKFDISLIRGLAEADGDRRKIVSSLVKVVQQLGIAAVAEGVETEEDVRQCNEIGFRFAQGFFFGRPCPLHPGSMSPDAPTLHLPL